MACAVGSPMSRVRGQGEPEFGHSEFGHGDGAGVSSRLQRGWLVAAALAGAWRATPPPPISADDLAGIAPMLLESGSAPLAWWRLRNSGDQAASELATSDVATAFRNSYYWHSVEAHHHERSIAAIVAAFRDAGIEALIAKGWAVARLYPNAGLRPYSDIDVCTRPAQRAAAEAVIATLPPASTPVDLHAKIVDMPDRSFDGLLARSCVAPLGDVDVRIFGPEDHLRFLCLHLLRHGGRRPLWLCDVGVVLDSLPPDFDWDHFLSGERRRTDWALGVLGLASRLLDAPLAHEPIAGPSLQLAGRLLPTVLRQWGEETFRPRSARLMRSALGRVDWFLHGLRERWPNPIEATYGLDGSIDSPVQFRYQVRAYVERSISFAAGRPHGAH